MKINIGDRKIDTSEVVEADIGTQEIKLKSGELIRLNVPLFSTVISIRWKELTQGKRVEHGN